MIICYLCEHKILSEHDLECYEQTMGNKNLKCLCTCHVKSNMIFN